MHPLLAPAGAKFSDGTWKNLTFCDSEQGASYNSGTVPKTDILETTKVLKYHKEDTLQMPKVFLKLFQLFWSSFQKLFSCTKIRRLLKKMTQIALFSKYLLNDIV